MPFGAVIDGEKRRRQKACERAPPGTEGWSEHDAPGELQHPSIANTIYDKLEIAVRTGVSESRWGAGQVSSTMMEDRPSCRSEVRGGASNPSFSDRFSM